jgi:hypothetical protein
MKKIFIFLLALMLLMLSPLAFAEEEISNELAVSEEEIQEIEEEVLDEETVKETEIMSSSLGEEIRILQLQRVSLKRVIAGKKIVEILSDNNDLEIIFAEIELLNEQIMEMTTENTDVDNFVATKKDLAELSRNFALISKPLLTANQREEVRTVVDESEELAELTETIKEKIKEHNSEKVENALERMGVKNTELIEKIESGDASPQEIRDALKEGYNNLSEEEKRIAKYKIKEKVENRIENKEKIKQKIVQNYTQKKKDLLDKRLAIASPEIKEKIMTSIEEKQKVLQRKERVLNKALKDLKEKETQIIKQKINNRVKQKIVSNQIQKKASSWKNNANNTNPNEVIE